MNETNKLQRIEPQGAIELAAERQDPLSIIAATLRDGKLGVEQLERMMAMRREINAENAKKAYDAAMAAFQSECPIIVKTKAGAKQAYKYAPLDSIVAQVREIIRAHGFSFAITSEVDLKEGCVKAACRITHTEGHSESSTFAVPIDNKNPMMTDPQRFGGAMTFSKRYAFCNAFGILTADEDTDGGSKPPPPSPKKQTPEEEKRGLEAELWAVCEVIRGDDKTWDKIKVQLRAWKILDARNVSQLSIEELKTAIERTKIQLQEAQ